ncbi:MAG: helix-turn-helix domain-containing protein [Pseudomonadota bacterium]
MSPPSPRAQTPTTGLHQAVQALRAEPAGIADARALGQQAGVARTRLTELCQRHYHLSPNALIERARVDAARSALAEGARAASAGSDAGFASEPAYARSFQQYQGLTPAAYRTLASSGRASAFTLRLPAGFATEPVRHLMARDPSSASERVLETHAHGLRLERGFQDEREQKAAVLHLTVRGRDAHVHITPRSGSTCTPAQRLAAHAVARRLLGFETHLPALRAQARRAECAWFAPLLARRPGLRVPLMGSEYEALIWAILGQQVNLTFAAQLRAELIRLAQPALCADHPQLLPHPAPVQVAGLDPAELQRRRFSRSKAHWIVDLSAAIAEGHLRLQALSLGPADEAYAALVARKGIGDWTAQYVMLRGMGYNDCVPAADAGLMRNLHGILGTPERPKADDVARCLAPFAPARSVACQHLWAWQAGF